MSFFIELLRCILCCEEEDQYRYEADTSYRSTSWERRPLLKPNESLVQYGEVLGSESRISQNIGSTYFNSIRPTYEGPARTIQNPKPLNTAVGRPTSSSSHNQSSSKLLSSFSSAAPSRTIPAAASSPYKPQSTLIDAISAPKPSPLASKSPSSLKSSPQEPLPSCHSKVTRSSQPTSYSNAVPKSNSLPISSCKLAQSSSTLLPSSSSSALSRPNPATSSTHKSQSPLATATASPQPLPSAPKATTSTLNPGEALSKLPKIPSQPSPSHNVPATTSPRPSSFSVKASPSSPVSHPSFSKCPPSFKQTLSQVSSNSSNQTGKATYKWVQKGTSPIYVIPQAIKELIEKDKVPEVLKKPLSTSTYKDYFAALLYAEDFYIEKWEEFELENITLKLQGAEIYEGFRKDTYFTESYEKDDKTFVVFEVDKDSAKRPFLLSRDFVFARPSGSSIEPFQGFIYRVVKSTLVLVEFGEDFHSQHLPGRKYDVKFSFNRVCLKRAHQAIEAASGSLFRNFIFPQSHSRKVIPSPSPYRNYRLNADQMTAVNHIVSIQQSPPYLIEGELCVNKPRRYEPYLGPLSSAGVVVQEAVLELYRRSSNNRILICAPVNKTCDALLRSLKERIPESDMFRANAAFRGIEGIDGIDGVPIDILPFCPREGECFTCPPLEELLEFRVVLCTFISSFRLKDQGIAAGHFSHMFLVDTSSATEPEVMVTLVNLATEDTTVVVTGATGNRSRWVRSDIARKNGLMVSYFERLWSSEPYFSDGINHPNYCTRII